MRGLRQRPTDEIDVAGAWETLVRGLRLSPEFRVGIGLTLLLALGATAGRVVVPVAVQLTIDLGIRSEGGPNIRAAAISVGLAFVAVVATAVCGYLMNLRLARATETALSALRVRTFRHVHDLSVLHQASEHRGALVSRVTADIDTISQFMQWGGIVLLVSLGQLALTTVIMLAYSWQLALVVVVATAPLVLVLRWFQTRLSQAYAAVRVRVGEMLTRDQRERHGCPGDPRVQHRGAHQPPGRAGGRPPLRRPVPRRPDLGDHVQQR